MCLTPLCPMPTCPQKHTRYAGTQHCGAVNTRGSACAVSTAAVEGRGQCECGVCLVDGKAEGKSEDRYGCKTDGGDGGEVGGRCGKGNNSLGSRWCSDSGMQEKEKEEGGYERWSGALRSDEDETLKRIYGRESRTHRSRRLGSDTDTPETLHFVDGPTSPSHTYSRRLHQHQNQYQHQHRTSSPSNTISRKTPVPVKSVSPRARGYANSPQNKISTSVPETLQSNITWRPVLTSQNDVHDTVGYMHKQGETKAQTQVSESLAPLQPSISTVYAMAMPPGLGQ